MTIGGALGAFPILTDAVSGASQAAPAAAQAADATSAASQAAAPGAAQAMTQAASDAVSSATHAAAAGGPLAAVYYFIMVPMVYLALAALIIGVIWRITVILRSPANPSRLTLYPASRRPGLTAALDSFGMRTVLKHKPVFWVFLIVFHVAFILLIIAHLEIIPALRILPATSKHMLGAGSVGVALTLAVLYFIFRRFRSPVREISTPADYLLLLLLLFLFLLGDMISWSNSWGAHGFVMTKKDFAKYFDGLARFTFADPRAVLHGSHYHFVVLHVLLANLFFILLPFTKIMHTFLSLPVNLLRRR